MIYIYIYYIFNLRLHSLTSVDVARFHLTSLYKGRHFSQSGPSVLWRHSHTSLRSPFIPVLATHLLACPLHLQRAPTAISEMA